MTQWIDSLSEFWKEMYSMRGYIHSIDQRLKQSIRMKGISPTTSHKNKVEELLKSGDIVFEDLVSLPLCRCGCKRQVKVLGRHYLAGHNNIELMRGSNNPCRGKHPTEETRKNMSNAQLNRVPFSPNRQAEIQEKIRVAKKGYKHSPETIVKIKTALKGKLCGSPLHHGEHVVTAKGKHNISIAQRKRFQNNTEREKVRDAVLKEWCDPNYISKQMKSRNVTPNRSEIKLLNILDNIYPNIWKFVGDGRDIEFIIAGKVPDYANYVTHTDIIELYGNYWHKDDNPQDRIDLFAKHGYRCIVIWDDELNNTKTLEEKLRKCYISN